MTKMSNVKRAQLRGSILLVPLPLASLTILEPVEAVTPAQFWQSVHGIEGGRARSRTLSRKRRQQIATKAAQRRWQAVGTTCKAEAADDARVTCDDCGLSWAMGNASAPACPRLAHLQVMPPVEQLEERARDICFHLLHGGSRRDFDEYLTHRPDWQAHVSYVVLQLMETCSH